MKKINIIMGILLMVAFSSCTIQSKTIPSASLNAQVNLTMSDLEYIGDVTGNATQSYILFIPYGGRKYHLAAVTPQGILGSSNVPLNRGLQNALYDALQQKPNADFVFPLSIETKRHQMFLGSRQEYTVRAKAFRIKTN